jgi:hypothetical protein
MLQRLQFLCLALLTLATRSSVAQSPPDAFERALAGLGLTKATARFDYADMNNFGGGEFQLPFFRSLHGDPYKVPAYTQAVATELKANAGKLLPLLTFGSARLDELVRRGLIG